MWDIYYQTFHEYKLQGNRMNLEETDVIFISYDEPNKEYNWAHLLKKCPWAKRVDGVYGSDAAHKAAAHLSESDNFFTVDGDNLVNDNFLDPKYFEPFSPGQGVVSFKAKNSINDLVYGNGGVKIWNKLKALSMKTHEKSIDTKFDIEFCWIDNYQHWDWCLSETVINSTPYQAFRAGFREGVKMSFQGGEKINTLSWDRDIARANLYRLIVWCNVGNDRENGRWAIYGARLGCFKTCFTDWDYREVRDFKKLWGIWEGACPAIKQSTELGDELNQRLGLPMGEFSPREAEVLRCLKK